MSTTIDNEIGCVLCTSNDNCITHDTPLPTKEEKTEIKEIEEEAFLHNEAAARFREHQRLDSFWTAPPSKNEDDTPFCCARPELIENRRNKGGVPEAVEGNIYAFIAAVKSDAIVYLVNHVQADDVMDAAMEVVRVNPLKRRVDVGSWLFVPNLRREVDGEFSGVVKTHTIGFRSAGVRSYLFFTCKACKKSFKIGYLPKTINPITNTQTFEYDEDIDKAMNIPNPPNYPKKFACVSKNIDDY